MDVLVDTNAVQRNDIDSAAFRSFLAYLRTTRSRFLLPSVVLEELCANRRRRLEKLEHDLDVAYTELRRLYPGTDAAPPALDKDAAVAAYRDQLLTCAERVEVLENDPRDLEEMVRRLVHRIPPASANGEEARDVLIWLALLPAARMGHVAFVSGDHKAFFSGETLRHELLTDLGSCTGNLEAFQDLDQFLRRHHSRSSFIDRDWVKSQIDSQQVQEAVEAFIEQHDNVFDWYVQKKGEPTGYVSLIQLVQHELEDYFVSDVAPDELYVSVTVWAELEVEVEYEPRSEWGTHRAQRASATCECIYPCVTMRLQLDVVGNDVRRAVVSEMEDG
jgi:hypothetical protein